jgi:hypothetical protein
MNYFSTVKYSETMTDNLNFKTVWNSAVSLYIMATGNNLYELSIASGKSNSIIFQCLEDPSYYDL